MTARIPLSVPSVGPRERELLLEAFDSGWIAPAGPQLDAFEAAICERTGRARAIALSSGSAAVHLALLVAGVRPGDRVACPTLTFIATAGAIVHAGAQPVLVDSDASGNLSPELLERALTEAADRGRPIAAVLPVDLYGKVADHVRLEAIARSHGAAYVVDAAESLGAHRDGAPAGSQGTAAALSFNGNKIATASSGGAVVTDDDALADRVRHLATQAREPVVHYEHLEVGFNYRLSNILAALGLAQLARLDELISARRAHRARYRALCEDLPGVEILGGPDDGDNCWLTSILVDPARTGLSTAALRERLTVHGIESRPVFAPMHAQPAFAHVPAADRVLDGTADRLYATGLSLPSSPASSPADIAEVCDRIRDAVRSPMTGVRA